MAKPSIIIAALLIALGAYGYSKADPKEDTGKPSPTALIPAFFGAPILACGILALNPARRKHAMHGAAAIGLLGLIGAVVMLIKNYNAGTLTGLKPFSMGGMAILCLMYVLLCVRSFLAARKEMEEG